jgi:hypothetical protein
MAIDLGRGSYINFAVENTEMSVGGVYDADHHRREDLCQMHHIVLL